MAKARVASGKVRIDTLRRQIVALVDADCVRPEDGQALLAALDEALQETAAGDMPAAGGGIERFIAEARRLIETGMLAGREGKAALEGARHILSDRSGCGAPPLSETGEREEL